MSDLPRAATADARGENAPLDAQLEGRWALVGALARAVPALGCLSGPGEVAARADAVPGAGALFGPLELGRLLLARKLDALVVDRGQVVSPTRPRSLTGLGALLGSGRSLVVRRAERHDEPLAGAARAAETLLGGRAHVQLFVTPPRGNSFGWHYDAEDVLILQTGGVKDYYFRANTVDPGARRRPPFDFGLVRHETSPTATTCLGEGDLLYLPRGTWHVGVARSEAWSVSIGVARSPASAAR